MALKVMPNFRRDSPRDQSDRYHRRRMRKSPRKRSSMGCELVNGCETLPGRLIDVSARGLAVATDLQLPEGTTLGVVLRPRGEAAVELEAIVWHVRRLKSNHVSFRLGLILMDPPEVFSRMAVPAEREKPVREGARLSVEERARADQPTATRPKAPLRDPPFVVEQLSVYRVRLSLQSSPRTRLMTVAAASREDAKELALSHVDGGWAVLEVCDKPTGLS